MNWRNRPGLWGGLLSGICLLMAITPLGTLGFEGDVTYDDGLSVPRQDVISTSLDWLEPRGLNIVDLVGQVPDEYLAGSIISYTPGYGIVRYQSGQRSGSTVTITTDVYPRYIIAGDWSGTMFGCLGQPARIDQWGTVSPAATVRIYNEQGADVTRQVDFYLYVPAGLRKPIRNPQQSESQNEYRYWESDVISSKFTADGALILPANMGCEVVMSFRNYRRLTAVFTLQVEPQISVEVVGEETFTFHSYLGVGYAGLLQPLVDQLNAQYGGRHEKFDLHIPAQANYMWLNFPPMPVDPYTQFSGNRYGNIDRPVGGTYRTDASGGLSVDHVNSMGLPIYGDWKDMDLSGGSTYLPYLEGAGRLAAPEYFVPAGVSYDPCMALGNCSRSVLDAIYNTPMEMQVTYFRVERTGCELQRIPLRMVGPGWSPTMQSTPNPLVASYLERLASGGLLSIYPYRVYLPLVMRGFCNLPPDDPSGCPCGWITPDGRMLSFIP